MKVVLFTTTKALSSSVAAMHAASRLAALTGSYASFCRTTFLPRMPPHALIWSVNTWNMSLTSPTGSEKPRASSFSSCERIWTTLMVPLVGAGPVFVQKLSVGENGLVPVSVAAPAPWLTGAVNASATAVTHTATSEPTPLCTACTLDGRLAHASSRGSAVR